MEEGVPCQNLWQKPPKATHCLMQNPFGPRGEEAPYLQAGHISISTTFHSNKLEHGCRTIQVAFPHFLRPVPFEWFTDVSASH